MKEATGELNMTVVTIIAIGAVIAFFWFMWPQIRTTITGVWSKDIEGSKDNMYQNGGGKGSGETPPGFIVLPTIK